MLRVAVTKTYDALNIGGTSPSARTLNASRVAKGQSLTSMYWTFQQTPAPLSLSR